MISNLFANSVFTWDDIENIIPEGRGLCLDIGCGSGRHRQQIEKAGYKWVGIDIDTSRGTARLLEGDACSLPYKSGVFNLVWMNCVLEHVRNPWLTLAEVHRVLARGGIVAGVSGYLDPDPTHICLLTHIGLKQVLTDVGFKHLYLTPGTIAFPVILRKFLMSLFGYREWCTRISFFISRYTLIFFLTAYFSIGLLKNAFYGRNLSDYKKRIKKRYHDICRDFTAYWIFCAWK